MVEELAGVTTKVVDPELEEHCKVRAGWVCRSTPYPAVVTHGALSQYFPNMTLTSLPWVHLGAWL